MHHVNDKIILEEEIKLCELLATQCKFSNLEKFFNTNSLGVTQEDLMIAQNFAFKNSKKNVLTNEKKIQILKEYTLKRLQHKRCEITHRQSNFIIFLQLVYTSNNRRDKNNQLLPPQPNFQVIGVSLTGTASLISA